MNYTKAVTAGLKCSPLCGFQDSAILSRCTASAPSTTGKQSNHLANIFQHFSTKNSFWRTWQTPHSAQNETIPASSRTMENPYCSDCSLPTIARVYEKWIWCIYWEKCSVGLGQNCRQYPNQPDANGFLLESICEKDKAAQLQCIE